MHIYFTNRYEEANLKRKQQYEKAMEKRAIREAKYEAIITKRLEKYANKSKKNC